MGAEPATGFQLPGPCPRRQPARLVPVRIASGRAVRVPEGQLQMRSGCAGFQNGSPHRTRRAPHWKSPRQPRTQTVFSPQPYVSFGTQRTEALRCASSVHGIAATPRECTRSRQAAPHARCEYIRAQLAQPEGSRAPRHYPFARKKHPATDNLDRHHHDICQLPLASKQGITGRALLKQLKQGVADKRVASIASQQRSMLNFSSR